MELSNFKRRLMLPWFTPYIPFIWNDLPCLPAVTFTPHWYQSYLYKHLPPLPNSQGLCGREEKSYNYYTLLTYFSEHKFDKCVLNKGISG